MSSLYANRAWLKLSALQSEKVVSGTEACIKAHTPHDPLPG